MNKDLIAWKEMIAALNDENSELKQTIEDIEVKNKKLGETMNTHMFNQATEYKQRMLTLFMKSDSPTKLNKLLSNGHEPESKKRMDKILEDEQMNTNKGINNITHHVPLHSDKFNQSMNQFASPSYLRN
jgi:uncharacterized coiled-coil DUF342 family protein